MKQLNAFIRENRTIILLTVFSPLLFLAVFVLYGLSAEPFLYASLLYLLLWILSWSMVFLRWRGGCRTRAMLERSISDGNSEYPEARSLSDADYLRMLNLLENRARALTDQAVREHTEAQDYYTLWVHQIKTPISAMRMQLQADEPLNPSQLETELFRIEQYAEMALNYIRLENAPNDLSIREQSLDVIMRGCIRKYAPVFISKKLRLQYDGTQTCAVTDAKWVSFILEQLLSNAVKYTPDGSVSISVAQDSRITITDTGIGIAPEDLPRIFEKGFTGHNGRADQRATGLGLYLAGKAAKRLGITISVTSRVGEGTSVSLFFDTASLSID